MKLPKPAWLARPAWVTDNGLRATRWIAVSLWIAVFGEYVYEKGLPYLRSDLLMWMCLGLVAASIGKRNILTVALDFLPFALVLIAYDYLRGLSDSLGMPTWWHPQVDIDKAIFFGHEPTLWLQEHIKFATVQSWEGLVALCYVSFFFLPYVTAAVLWLRSRRDFYRWSLRFVGLSFVGFTFFALIPAAPPWAAARCTAAQVADHPYNPPCMSFNPQQVTSGGLLGKFTTHQPGANAWVEPAVGRGFSELHLSFAAAVIKTAHESVDNVAAVPSLHAGGIMLFTIFMWNRLNKWWRPFLVAYPIFMAFTLVFAAEHFFADVLAGWLAAAIVCALANWIERWRKPRRRTDTLETPDQTTVENAQCPPTSPLPAMTPSST